MSKKIKNCKKIEILFYNIELIIKIYTQHFKKMLSYITIRNIPNSAQDLYESLKKLNLLTPKKICIFPEFIRNKLRFTAYIKIAEWHDSEAAYNLIKNIKNPRKEARVVYSDDNWWAIEETAQEDICQTETENAAFQRWITEFEKEELTDTESESDSELDLYSDVDLFSDVESVELHADPESAFLQEMKLVF